MKVSQTVLEMLSLMLVFSARYIVDGLVMLQTGHSALKRALASLASRPLGIVSWHCTLKVASSWCWCGLSTLTLITLYILSSCAEEHWPGWDPEADSTPGMEGDFCSPEQAGGGAGPDRLLHGSPTCGPETSPAGQHCSRQRLPRPTAASSVAAVPECPASG